jgi:hypothetical protein
MKRYPSLLPFKICQTQITSLDNLILSITHLNDTIHTTTKEKSPLL